MIFFTWLFSVHENWTENNVQRKSLKDLQNAWKTIAQYQLKQWKEVWLPESEMQRNQGWLKTFAQ